MLDEADGDEHGDGDGRVHVERNGVFVEVGHLAHLEVAVGDEEGSHECAELRKEWSFSLIIKSRVFLVLETVCY